MTEMSQQEINKILLKEIERLKGVHEVQDVMSRYFHWHTAAQHKKCYELFAKKAPDVSAEVANWGKWEGTANVRKLFYELLPMLEGDRIGQMYVHTLDTPQHKCISCILLYSNQ